MIFLNESHNYILGYEYETVFLRRKDTGTSTLVGDFYGDAVAGFISSDERCFISCGLGIIIYVIEEPFMNYEYSYKSSQWIEFRREDLYIESGTINRDANIVMLIHENNKKHRTNLTKFNFIEVL